MTGLSFADTGAFQRVVGNKINKEPYRQPEGWEDERLEPTWKAGGVGARPDSILVVLQPDTSLDLSPSGCSTHTYIQLFKRTEELVEVLARQTAEDLQDMMALGKKMAKGHLERFKTFERLPPKQACLIFGGDLRAADFSPSDQKFAQSHLRFLSGLYGVLRPYDDVKPVRDLPMGAKITTKRGKTLQEFWGDAITKQLGKDALATKAAGKTLLLCCTSPDYWRAVQATSLPDDVEVVVCTFKGGSDESAKCGRSQLARHIVRHRLSDMDELREWDHDDWCFNSRVSTNSELVFVWRGDEDDAPKKDKKEKKSKKKQSAREQSPTGSSRSEEVREKKTGTRTRSRELSSRSAQRPEKKQTTREHGNDSCSPSGSPAKKSKKASKTRRSRSSHDRSVRHERSPRDRKPRKHEPRERSPCSGDVRRARDNSSSPEAAKRPKRRRRERSSS